MSTNKMTKEELTELIKTIVSEVLKDQKTPKKRISPKHYSNQAENFPATQLETIIGSIPFILLDKQIFQKNIDVIEFANKIGIPIPNGEKRALDEIVGRIIAAIKDFPPSRISQLNAAVEKVKSHTSSSPKKDKKSFFEQWDKVIKSIN